MVSACSPLSDNTRRSLSADPTSSVCSLYLQYYLRANTIASLCRLSLNVLENGETKPISDNIMVILYRVMGDYVWSGREDVLYYGMVSFQQG